MAVPESLPPILNGLPAKPGCYLMKSADGAVIYVGKAINLRSRVRSYFQPSADHGRKVAELVAHVADVSVDEKDGKIKVHRIICAVDCGKVVNPGIITAQMESGILMGLSAVLKERVEFANGGVKSANFYDYEILRMGEVPDIEVHLVKSNETMGGVGEPGLPPVAPALGNAVFHAAGVRIRRLPMTPKVVLESMRKTG